ncbi:MAG: extracellular elastinolytic metalloproteinase [Actinomycetota bacterium]|nr:extracellular elastinolytic metalloproteinase [Actinomycetota bacterium]
MLVLGTIGMPAATAKKKKKPTTQTVTFSEEGAIRVAGPTGAALKGVTEAEFTLANSCATPPVSQGHDGYVIELPAEYAMGTGTIEVKGADTTGAYDLDLYFYDAGCTLMDPYLTEGADPSGAINGGAKWAVVNLFVGANATFKLTATATIPAP